MKFLVVEGKVVGGHYLEDLDVFVPYQKEKRIQYKKTEWSRDLDYALREGMVKKKGVTNHKLREDDVYSGNSNQVKPSRNVQKTKSDVNTSDNKNESSNEKEEKSFKGTPSKDVEELKDMNSELVEATKDLIDNQNKLMGRLDNVVDVSLNNQVVPVENKPKTKSSDSNTLSEKKDNAPMFIPSEIRSGDSKSTGNIEVTKEEEEDDSSLDAATKALKEMREDSE